MGIPVYPLEIDHPQIQKAIETFKSNPNGYSTAGLEYATVTWQSNQHEQNQDRAVVFYPFRTQQSRPNHPTFLVAIFDGHGVEGHLVADYVVKAFPRLLADKLNQQACCAPDEWIIQQLKDTFVEIDSNAPTSALRGGCTGSVTLRLDNRLFVANAGDSRTILANYHTANQTEISYMSRKDKPNLPDERSRIEALGGKIHIPPKNPALSRVVVFSKAASPPESIGLAMSRSIGDQEWTAVGVTAEPLVDVMDVSNLTRSFVVAASDGLWDLRRPQFFAKQFGASLYADGSHPLVECVETILKVSPQEKEWYRDDITAIAIKVD
jgi:serine/threonine protein phosphatase PrpC